MSKFKSIFLSSSNSRYDIGVYSTKESASEHAYEYARQHGHLAGCDTKEDVLNALMERDYYMLAYGPRELEVEEVEA